MSLEELMEKYPVDENELKKAEKNLDAYINKWQRKENLKQRTFELLDSFTKKPQAISWQPAAT